MYAAAIFLPLIGFVLGSLALMSSFPPATRDRVAQIATSACVCFGCPIKMKRFSVGCGVSPGGKQWSTTAFCSSTRHQ
jgi:hypothetical protein